MSKEMDCPRCFKPMKRIQSPYGVKYVCRFKEYCGQKAINPKVHKRQKEESIGA